MKSYLALVAVSVFAVSACGGGDDDGPKVVLGAIIDQTGNNSELSWLQAVELATAQMNDALAAEGVTSFRFKISAQNSENDIVGGPDSRAIRRILDSIDAGAKAATIDTTQIAEEANKPSNLARFQIPLQCSSCTGGSFLSPTSAEVAGDPELTASRRNTEFWMSRTIMSTGLQAAVVAQLIKASGSNGDINGDGVIKVVNFGSNEPFGSATTTAVATELLKLYTAEEKKNVHFERLLHDNAQDPRDIDFRAAIARLTNDANEDMPPTAATSVNGHLFGVAGANLNTTDGKPDFITVATFGRNDVAFINEIKNENPQGLGTTMRVLHFQTFRFSSNLLALGELAEGEIGVSHVVKDGPQGEQFAVDFKEKFGLVPVYRDSIYYDNAMTLLLAAYTAIQDVADPTTVQGQAIRDVMPCSSVTAARKYAPTCEPVAPATTCVARPLVSCPAGAATEVGPGVESIRLALRTIQARQPIEYTGASGPVDYDVAGNVKNRVASFTVQGGRYVDIATFDCISSNACPCLSGECPGQ